MTDIADSDAPFLVTATHVYIVLPVDRWPDAYRFIADTVGPETLVETDPESTSILAAVGRESLAIEGVLFVNRVVIAQHFACLPQAGISYGKFHELIRTMLPDGTLYYSDGAEHQRAVAAAVRAGLSPVGRLWQNVVGWEGEHAVGSTGRGSGELSGGAAGPESGPADPRR
jgi:hypothetical protein